MKMMKTIRSAAFIYMILLPCATWSTEFFVDCDAGNDTNAGTESSLPKKTIQAAIDASVSGDTINVSPGEYGPIMTANKAITIVRDENSYLGEVIIEGGHTSRCANLGIDSSQTSTTLKYITIRNGSVSGSNGGGVRGGTLYNCRIVSCSASGGAGGGAFGSHAIGCVFSGNSADRGGALAEGYAARSEFFGNSAGNDGGAVYCSEIRDSLIDMNEATNGDVCGGSNTCVNCTIVNNVAPGGVAGPLSKLVNCIAWENVLQEADFGDGASAVSCLGDVDFSLLGTDPGFKDADNRDYRLEPGSPCVDAGANEWVNTVYDMSNAKKRILNGVVDVGCYECYARWPSPAITDCSASQEVMDVLSDGSVSATVLKCLGDISTFTNGIAGGLPFDSGICLDTGSRNVFSRGSYTNDVDLVRVVAEVDPSFSIGGHISVFEFETVATSELLSFHYAYASSEFDQLSKYSDPFALLVSVNGSDYENLAKLDNGMPVSIKNLRAGRNKEQNDYGNRTTGVSSTEYFEYWSMQHSLPYVWDESVIYAFQGGHPVDGITMEFCAEKAVTVGDHVKLKFVIADTGDMNYDSFVFIKADSLGFAEIAGAPIADPATDVSKTGFMCNWHKVTGAVSYQVDVSTDPDFNNLLPGCSGAVAVGNQFRVNGSFPEDGVYYYRVRAVGSKGTVSANSNSITVVIPTTEVAAPTISPGGCEFTGSIGVTIVNNHSGATLYYTTDGMNPTVYSSTITSGGSLTLTTNTTVKAIAIYKGVSSPVVSQTYTLPPPVTIPSQVLNVKASDGTSPDGVSVTWSAPASSSVPITAYEVSRKPKSGSTWSVVSASGTGTSFFDSSAQPGIDYTYRVRAQNSAGWGDYGSDDGWRAVSLSLSPTTLSFGYAASSKSVTVTANATWNISGTSGCASATKGSGSISVSVTQNGTLSSRSGSVTVTAGSGTAHPASATVSITQSKRPAILTKLEITGGDTSLEGGESTTFHAIATFDDGTTRDVTTAATWSITAGGTYGSVGAHTGKLTTYKTTETSAGLTVKVTYTNADYTSVTKSDSVNVTIGFTASLRRPVSLTVNGDHGISIGETKLYTATVTYNDGTTTEKTLHAATVWTVAPASPVAEIAKGSAAAELTPHAGGNVLTVTAAYSETVAKLTGTGTEAVTVSGTLPVTVAAPISLPVAVDVETPGGAKICDLAIATSSSVGGNVWYGQSAMSHDSTDAGQSGYLTGAGTNTMSTVVTNAGTISFWWKVSSEPVYDTLSFSIDGVTKARISGTSGDWRQLSFSVGAGTHTFAWSYGKDAENNGGQDAGWVDQIAWVPLAVPGAPGVSASDGSSVNGVDVTWTAPATGGAAESYEISRAEKGSGAWTVLTSGFIGTAWTDSTAVPGVDYTYRVRAGNAAGSGAYGSDDGWCGISLAVNPSTLEFEHLASAQSVAVKSSASSWTATAGEGWITVAKGTTNVNVSVGENAALAERTGTVTVTAGSGAHAVSATVTVTQVGRPPDMDVGFAMPYEDWRTRMQVSTNTTPDTYYAPVSVFTAGKPLDISFGWTNKSEAAVSMPSVHFRIFRNGESGRICVSDWTAAGRAGEKLGIGECGWSGHWTCSVFKVLKPGDYLLEAEIAPAGTFDDVDRGDNTAVFRFAVRDPTLSADDTFAHEEGWTNLVFAVGNDFAQPPHVAVRQGSAGTNETTVQFGPYVPMNGVNGHASSSKNALDLVFLVDYSGSQSTTIQGLVNNIGDFIDQLFLGDPANGVEPVSDLRVKIAGFSDYRSDRNRYEWFYEGEFTTDRTRLKSDLSYIKGLCNTYGGGGYNGGESSYDALYYICKGWRPNAKKSPTGYLTTLSAFRDASEASRAVILITDEPPHLPLDANGCSGKGTSDLAAALSDANINLTIVGDGEYRSKDSGQPLFAANKLRHQQFCNAYPEICELIETGGRGTLPEFTGNVDKLKWLAATVAAKVVTVAEVVEPVFSAVVRGGGTLKFDWKNDSMATTNNTFSFECEGVTNLTKAAGGDWETVTLELGEGLHVFNWSYGKLGGYVSDIVTDCGVLSNVRWEPWHTELEIEPPRVPTYYTGLPITQTNDEDTVVFDVNCNSIWKVVGHSDWITVVQGNGTGDGDLVVTVATNNTYAERLGYITVRAGEYGLPSDAYLGTPERTVFIEQEATPYNEDGSVEVLTVDIKPRWPWDRKVDIDFRVKTPAKVGTPVRVKVWGLNKEGGDMITHYPTAAMLQECAAKTGVEVGFGSTNYNPVVVNNNTSSNIGGIDSDGMAYIVCPTSGLYRFTWDMAADWKAVSDNAVKSVSQGGTGLGATRSPWANGSSGTFHTPEFSVRLQVTPVNPSAATNASHEKEASETRCVDMRLVDLNTSWTRPSVGREGGSVLTGIERIGHPFGYADPLLVDTTDTTLFESNGWNHLNFMERKWEEEGFGKDMLRRYPVNKPHTLTNRTDIACVLNNENVAVHGGMITSDVHWTADKIHVVRDNVFVAPGAKLTIEADAIVKVCIDTRIYIWENDAASDVTQRHNIVFEGVYLPRAFDSTYGGDTFYLGDNAGSGSSAESKSKGSDILYSQVQTGKTFEMEEIYLGTKCANRAVYTVALKKTYLDVSTGKGKTEDFKFKYYSRGQKYGEFLRPSEPGYEFYGWYSDQPTGTSILGNTLDAGKYEDSKAKFVDHEGCPFPTTASGSALNDKTVWALICPIGWSAAPLPKSATGGRLVLATESVVYDGNDHTGDIKVRELWLGAVDISNSISSVNVPFPCVNVGEYAVTVNFAADYANSPSATFRILPRAAEGARLVFSPASMMYERTLLKPSVDVLLPDGTTLPADGYAVRWLDADGRWPNIGKYKVEAAFTGNYSGTPVTNEFEIAVNPDYVYKEYAAEELVRKAVSDKPTTEDGTAPRRILYIGGRENDAMTEYVKDLLARDIELCDFINANFACWADDIDAAGSKGALYAAGLQSDTPPILAIVSANDTTRALAAHSGYIARDELWDFLVAAKTLPEDVSSASLSLSSAILEYNGKMQRPAVSVVYAGTDIPVSEGELVWSGGCTNVGVYTVKAVFDGGPYVGETAAATFEIVPAALPEYAVELVPDAVVYDGETHKPAVSVPDGVSASVDYGAGDYTAAGTYDVSVTGAGNYRGTVAKTFTISRRPVSAWIELDSAKVEITDEKPPADPLRPWIIAVKDGTCAVYSGGVDYTVDWGGGDYMTPGTNTITATFIGNYEGVATATFVIERVEPPASKFNPSTGEPVKVSAPDAATAAGMVEIVVPDAVAARVSITDEAYGKYFEKRATYDVCDGLWAVDAVLKADVVFPEEADGEMERAVLDGVLDPATDSVTVRSVPGIYYRLLGANTPDRSRFAGKDAVLATGACVTLEKPGVSGSPAFYMLSASPKE